MATQQACVSLKSDIILPFDTNAAQHDTDFTVATRDASAFDAAGVDVINPWTIPAP